MNWRSWGRHETARKAMPAIAIHKMTMAVVCSFNRAVVAYFKESAKVRTTLLLRLMLNTTTRKRNGDAMATIMRRRRRKRKRRRRAKKSGGEKVGRV